MKSHLWLFLFSFSSTLMALDMSGDFLGCKANYESCITAEPALNERPRCSVNLARCYSLEQSMRNANPTPITDSVPTSNDLFSPGYEPFPPALQNCLDTYKQSNQTIQDMIARQLCVAAFRSSLVPSPEQPSSPGLPCGVGFGGIDPTPVTPQPTSL